MNIEKKNYLASQKEESHNRDAKKWLRRIARQAERLSAFQIDKNGCNSKTKQKNKQGELGDYLVEEKIAIL